MATPSSSATTPSPPLAPAYLHTILPGPEMDVAALDIVEQHDRQRAVDNFLARAELATLTRSLRTRLSYASFKASHNMPQASLSDLEARVASVASSPPQTVARTIPAKRKPGPSSSGSFHEIVGATPLSRQSSQGTMGPPTGPFQSHQPISAASLRALYQSPGDTNGMSADGPSKSLFASILAPPPAKQARTIHNPSSPRVAAPTRPAPPTPGGIARSRSRHSVDDAPGRSPRRTGAGARQRAHSHSHTQVRSPARSDKGKERAPVGEDDMKAAATLTMLMSRGGVPASPRSALSEPVAPPGSGGSGGGGPGGGSGYLHPSPSPRMSAARAQTPSDGASPVPAHARVQPPPALGATTPQRTLSQRSEPSDTEAADLMLFLATSPSPARRERERRSSEGEFANRGLGGADGLRTKGRVLFANTGTEEAPPPMRVAQPLQRGSSGSFGQMPAVPPGSAARGSPLITEITPATPTEEHTPFMGGVAKTPTATVTLLPGFPPVLPRQPPQSLSAASANVSSTSSISSESSAGTTPLARTQPLTPTVSFNLNDFVHDVSPSPAAVIGQRQEGVMKGRRLFEV